MQYQNFRGADLKEALSAVKATLGPNALIEGTRQISNGRGGGLGHSYVEVTAAAPAGLKWPYANREAAAAAEAAVPMRRRETRKPATFGRSAQKNRSRVWPAIRARSSASWACCARCSMS